MAQSHAITAQRMAGPVGGWQDGPYPRLQPLSQGYVPWSAHCTQLEAHTGPRGSHTAPPTGRLSKGGQREGVGHCLIPTPMTKAVIPTSEERGHAPAPGLLKPHG